MLSEQDWSRLTRLVAGEASPFEQLQTKRWIQEDPERQRAYAELIEIWSARGPAVEVDQAWSRFVGRLEGDPKEVQGADSDARSSRPRRRAGGGRVMLARAAAIVFLVAVGSVLARGLDLRSPAQESRWAAGPSHVTNTGELAHITLADGTDVVIGVQSRLRVALDFGAETRDVQVEGEAFFRVAPDARRPFTVHTAEARTRVLGTSFSVSSRGAGTETIVQQGTVRVTPSMMDGEPAELLAGDLGRVLPDGRHVEVTQVDLDERLAWIDGRLVFRNTPFHEVLNRMELWYDVEFRVRDDVLSERRLSASLEHPPLGDLLNAIAAAADASYYTDEGIVTFAPNP